MNLLRKTGIHFSGSCSKKLHGRHSMRGKLLRFSFLLVSTFLAAGLFASPQVNAKEPKLETSDAMIPSGDAGIQLFVRNKHLAGRESSPDKILLLRTAGSCRASF